MSQYSHVYSESKFLLSAGDYTLLLGPAIPDEPEAVESQIIEELDRQRIELERELERLRDPDTGFLHRESDREHALRVCAEIERVGMHAYELKKKAGRS